MTHWNKVNFSLTGDLTQHTTPCPNLPQIVQISHINLQVEISQTNLTCTSQLDGQRGATMQGEQCPEWEDPQLSRRSPSEPPSELVRMRHEVASSMAVENWERLRRLWKQGLLLRATLLLPLQVGGNNPNLQLFLDTNFPRACELLETVPNSPRCLLSASFIAEAQYISVAFVTSQGN